MVINMMQKRLDFYKGMDISFLPEFEDEGMQVKDFDGTILEPFDLISKYGVNAVRLRIWNQPENIKESKGYCSLDHTLAMAKRIKAHGMSFMLDFHYSDYWADPAKQNKPKAWSELSFPELEEAVFNYTRDTLLALETEGVLPDIVQIGNEIRSGLLFPDGELPKYKNMVALINSGIRGTRAVSDTIQIMLHLDQGGRYFYIKEWFSKSIEAGLLDFDIIGLSYYPFWHGTFNDLHETLVKLVEDYHKPLMIVETAHAWRKSEKGFIDESQEKIAGVLASPQGQRKVLDLVMNIVASMPHHMGIGVYYWEPLCLPHTGEGGWSENMGLLDDTGKVMEGMKAFLFTRDQLRTRDVAKVYEPTPIKVLVSEPFKLPQQLSVLFYDGTLEKRSVIWQEASKFDQPGTYKLLGKVEGWSEPVSMMVQVVNQLDEGVNLLKDANWEEGLTQWEMERSDEQVVVQFYPEFEEPFPHPPVNALRIEAEKNFTFLLSQSVQVQKEGRYRLQVQYRGTDTTDVDIRLFVQTKEEIRETRIHPTEHDWTLYQVENIFCKPQELIVGIRIASPPVYGMVRKFCFCEESKMS